MDYLECNRELVHDHSSEVQVEALVHFSSATSATATGRVAHLYILSLRKRYFLNNLNSVATIY
jgi:hypothetical protein